MRIHWLPAAAAISITGLSGLLPSWADTPPAATPPASTTTAKSQPKLNLKVPDVNRSLTPAERRAALNPSDTNTATETVEVQRQRTGDAVIPPKPPGGLASVFWAFSHPVDAWRIFFPVPPEQRAPAEAPRNN